ncbi:uncharacterized protein LOC107607991 isoform X2 [Arachis ipaensis]|uniref:uncharacterized protein LOC107607991 isoform X2 n=1 Tax=Arachis ipaensis TaxID=130454 RepID=UPI000A2B6CA8|nr:uncharacterized protein LOC107607991 isoform X2 [Arachis ipaensis]XP_020962931.1 uncharacterized protein LOC107607991 isoform X2 [Arachis ipaensis]XP_020962932.1 uncharacterized protein LOC107607991 isoform X2 [Arachis ipaensis]XP_020962933.1 uncharacterized protein LOC107607991 isoform X2 [Arachis ipaensis]XP_020962934.1 uncharacterized protein LOC107607991 isoform X2 [Arachis ipaensis]XP_020962935.1 uncharacterized protein LOC107607991 isoform X2 [Arachis ipaensis]XP_020962936.1 uncharac
MVGDSTYRSTFDCFHKTSHREFINPYGISSLSQTQNDSEFSSDRMSQFGTARDYHDFDMQNEPYWYNEKDEDYFMTPNFEGPDFFGNQSEDKFVMTAEMENQHDNPLSLAFDHKKSRLEGNESNDSYMEMRLYNHSSVRNGNATYSKGYSLVVDNKDFEVESEGKTEKQIVFYGCEVPFRKGCDGSGEPCNGDPTNFSYPSLKEIHLNDFHLKVVGDISFFGSALEHAENGSFNYYTKKDKSVGYEDPFDITIKVAETDLPKGVDNHEARDDGDFTEECQDPDIAADGEVATDDELLKYTQEDEYEVFDLRIIHRKNRTGFEENKELPIVLNTIIAGRYYITEYLGSAAFSRVVQAHDLHTGIDVCLKIIKNDKDFFDQSLDEIKLLKLVNKHDPADQRHILCLYDYFYHQEHLFIVTELLRANLYEFQKFNQESGGEAYFTLNRLQLNTHSPPADQSKPTIVTTSKSDSKNDTGPSITSNSSGSKPTSLWISHEEWSERQRRGLCFRCADKWNLSHICKFRHQQLILLGEDDDEPQDLEAAPPMAEPDIALHTLSLHLSSLSYWGLTSHQTLKVRGVINGREVVILVDPGAEANFISSTLVSTLGLPLMRLPPFHIEVGNGAIEQGLGGCENVKILVQGISIIANFLVMELGRSEVVLGAGWVASLGKFEGDYNTLSLSWVQDGSKVTLQGDPTLGRTHASSKVTLQALRNAEEGFLVTPLFRPDADEDSVTISSETTELLSQFDDLFQSPSGLPPQRSHDHAIVLKENSDIPNIRLYRYPHYQKEEMEKIIEEMLQIGIIRPSTSPFSSPVILVKKKDGG